MKRVYVTAALTSRRLISSALAVACIVWAAPPANSWSSSSDVTIVQVTGCGGVAKYPKFCSQGSVAFLVDRFFVKGAGGAFEIDARMLRKVGKNWVNVPVKTLFGMDKWGRDTPSDNVLDTYGMQVFPMQGRLSAYGPGYYMLVFGKDIRAQWSCSIYSYDICKWNDAYSYVTKVRFYLDANVISQQQWENGIS
jgi:hypothetical protein